MIESPEAPFSRSKVKAHRHGLYRHPFFNRFTPSFGDTYVTLKEPKLLLNDNFAGKPEGIHLVIGRRPRAAFGNSTGDQQMLEYTTIDNSAGLGMLVLHDDATREYAYGPALGLPGTKVGTHSPSRFTMRPRNAVGSSSA